jgi:C-terminal processing protease CtpA/Prc
MHRVFVSSLLLFIRLCLAPVVAQERPQSLEPRKLVERELAGGQTHTYTLNLTENQIARVTAEQKGVDLVLSVFAPDGTRLFDVDSPNGTAGEEPATIAARQSGTYRLELRSLDKAAAAGRYALRLDGFLTEVEYLSERLAGLGRLWGAAKFFHPFLAYQEIDWDGALVKAIPLVKAARTPAEYRAAISVMLQALNDPATTAEVAPIEESNPASASAAAREPSYFRVVDGFVVVTATDWVQAYVSGSNAAFAKQPQMLVEIGKAKGIVIDCRYGGISYNIAPPFYLGFYLDNTLPSLVHGTVPLGTYRYRLYNGYAPQQGNSSGGYTSAFLIQTPGAIAGQAKEKKPLVVLIDEKTPNLLPILSGLQATGAKIVQVGRADNSVGARLHRMRLPDGVRVNLRVTEFVHPDGGSVFQPDVRLTNEAGAGDNAIDAAIAALNAPAGGKSTVAATTAVALLGQKDDPFPEMPFPTEEYRLLALFRFWNVINYFYPYKQLTDKPWGTVLSDFVPRFLDNKSALDYEITVAEMVAHLQDSHGFVRGLRNLDQHLGMFAPPLRLASAGGKLAVVALVDEAAAQAAGVKLGDVILAIDGEPVAERLAALTKLKALSTPQSAHSYIYPTALRGAKDTKVKLRVASTDEQVREVELTRTVSTGSVAGMVPRKTPVYQVLPNGYGYIDLARLPLPDAQKAMDAVLSTPALIFDMRGYPQGTAWAIAPRLSEKKNVTAAIFRRPLQAATNFDDEDLSGVAPDYTFEQKIPPTNGVVYKGKVVMLINEFAISQSEHTCLFFEAATSITFIGSPTNGANGDVTNFVLPGGIYVNFSGHDVRHGDGRQLQRVGIQAHIKVEPTPKGISEGRDEVLEAALKHLDKISKQ